jgi:hypothetical protein
VREEKEKERKENKRREERGRSKRDSSRDKRRTEKECERETAERKDMDSVSLSSYCSEVLSERVQRSFESVNDEESLHAANVEEQPRDRTKGSPQTA